MRTVRAIDLFCGKGGWAHGLIAAGWRVAGYDITDMGGYPGELHVADALELDGAEFADAELIVASPPCQFFSYMAMPWTRARRLAEETRACYGKLWRELRLFRACFRLQREAIAARGGRHLPMVVENVVGAQAWVGRAAAHYGSFYLWGDVPALLPYATKCRKFNPHHPGQSLTGGSCFFGNGNGIKAGDLGWQNRRRGKDGERSTMSFTDAAARKNAGGSWFNVAHNTTSGCRCNPVNGYTTDALGYKAVGVAHQRDGYSHTRHLTNSAESLAARIAEAPIGRKQGGGWWDDPSSVSRRTSSRSNARKEASALIAMIPFELARWIGECYYPHSTVSVRTAKALAMGVLG